MYSGLDGITGPTEKIWEETLFPRRPTVFETTRSELDQSHADASMYDLKDMDYFGMPAHYNVWKEIANQRALQQQQAAITHNPYYNYVTEDDEESPYLPYGYGGGPLQSQTTGSGGGYIRPPFYHHGKNPWGRVGGGGGKGMAEIESNDITGGQFGEILIPLAIAGLSGVAAPLIRRGASAVTNWFLNLFHKKHGKGMRYYPQHLKAAIGNLRGPDLDKIDKKILASRSSTEFWRKLHDETRKGIKKIVKQVVPSSKDYPVVGKAIDAITKGMLVGAKNSAGSGLISRGAHQKIVGGGQFEDDTEGELTMGQVLKPILENIVDKHIGVGLTVEQKEALLEGLAEADPESLSEPIGTDIEKYKAAGGSLLGKMKGKVKTMLKKLSKMPVVKDLVESLSGKAGEKLAPKIEKFAEKGVEKLFEHLPEGLLKESLEPLKESAKEVTSEMAKAAAKHALQVPSKALEAIHQSKAIVPSELVDVHGEAGVPARITHPGHIEVAPERQRIREEERELPRKVLRERGGGSWHPRYAPYGGRGLKQNKIKNTRKRGWRVRTEYV